MSNTTRDAVQRAFQSLDDQLKLDPTLRKKAQERHNAVRDCLKDAGLTSGGFLQGSFARATMLKPLKDVDTVNLVAAAWRETAEAPGGVQQMFDQFESVVSKEWPSARFDVEKAAGKALAVTFTDCTFTIDICAALPTATDDVVLLGDRNDEDEQWQKSLTRRLNRLVAARNQATNEEFVHQVRVLKTLKHIHRDSLDDVDGIVFESAAYWAVDTEMPFADAIAVSLRRAAQMLRDRMDDPAHEGDLTHVWSVDRRQRVVQKFTELADLAEAALTAADRDDQRAALEAWREVVGSDFGTELSSSANALSNWNTGGRETARWGVEHGDRRLAATPGRSWRVP